MPVIDPIQIVGLAQFRRNLRDLDTALPRALRLAGNEAANLVVDAARVTVPRRSGKAAASIKAKSSQSATRITSGGARAPYMPWLDYGGRVGKNNTARREFIKDGRYVYPAFRRERPNVEKVLREALERVAADAGIEIG